MKEIKIYTAGKMAGLSYEDMMGWRDEIEALVKRKTWDLRIRFIHPPKYFKPGDYSQSRETAVKEWDINQVKSSDIVVVNLSGINSSVGTHYELSMVDAINSMTDRHIFVVAVGKEENGLHPWIPSSIHYFAEDLDDAADYIIRYLLV